VIQSGSRARFALEPLQYRLIFGVVIRQKLERNSAAQARVFGFVHDSHTTRAELFENQFLDLFQMRRCQENLEQARSTRAVSMAR